MSMMMHRTRRAISFALAASLLSSTLPAAWAGPGDVNSVNDGHDIAGGTYYNTPGDKTTFVNSAGTGLYISPSTTVVGHEVDAATLQANGNGGNFHFSAPGQIVRIDGNVDVSGFINNASVGNAGRVTVDSAYLFQNGQIFANGANPGIAQANVGAMSTISTGASSSASTTVIASAVAPAQVNQTYDGHDVAGGTYYNTPGDKTTFTNSAGTGLYLGPSSTVVGREVDPGTLQQNGNGGWVHFNAPGQVVRLDGNVDVSGFLNNGTLGNGGRVTVDSAFLFQNGQIFANGANAGVVQFNVGSMTMGPTAAIQARGETGAGGRVDIKATGAVDISRGAIIDTSGEIIGTFNTNVINIEGGLVNLDGILMANGFQPGQRGGIVTVIANGNSTAVDQAALANAPGVVSDAERDAIVNRDSQLRANQDGDIKIGVDGQATANGADGVMGYNPTDGGDGGLVETYAFRNVVNDGKLTANGGKGGTNPDTAIGPVALHYGQQGQTFVDANGKWVYQTTDANGQTIYVDESGCQVCVDANNIKPVYQQASFGEDGGNGGNGGAVLVHYGVEGGEAVNNGAIEVKGGDGGDGQNALADAPGPEPIVRVATAGNGGNGGNGGYVELIGGVGAKLPSQQSLANINVDGGTGAKGGQADTLSKCDCKYPGANGGCGAPGQIVYRVDEIPPRPPERPESPVVFAPYPKEYPRLGTGLPQASAPVISYNRSIFLARSPMPIVQKRKPKPPEEAPPPPPPAPKPKPPEKKKIIRGFW